MNTSALITMIAVWTFVFGFTAYYFIKVLFSGKAKKPE
jgi:hypothetical protein